MQQPQSWSALAKRLPRLVSAAPLLAALASCHDEPPIPEISYLCGNQPLPEEAPGAARCGANDPDLPPEPYGAGANWPPPDPTDPACILKATRVTPPDGQVLDEPTGDVDTLDTQRINDALVHCKNGIIKLAADGDNNAFLAGNLRIDSATLWVDKGVTLFMTRNPDLMQKTGNCGVIGINDSGACTEFITVRGISPGIIGEGTIDGQGGEPLVGRPYSWWNMSYALREIDGSIGNPTMINTVNTTTGFLLYKITLHNSSKFHVKLTSFPNAGPDSGCPTPGAGFIVWGVTVLTPLYWLFDITGRRYQAPVDYPHFFFGFVSVAMAWQIAFLVIGSDPARFRPLMIPSMIEKAGFIVTLAVLYGRARIPALDASAGIPDLVLCLLFAAAFVRTRPSNRPG